MPADPVRAFPPQTTLPSSPRRAQAGKRGNFCHIRCGVREEELTSRFQEEKGRKVDFAPEIVVFYQGPMNQAVRVPVFDNRPAVSLGVSLLLSLLLIGVGLSAPTMSG